MISYRQKGMIMKTPNKGQLIKYKAIVESDYGTKMHWDLHSGTGHSQYRSIHRLDFSDNEGEENTGIFLGVGRLNEGHYTPRSAEYGELGTFLGYEGASFEMVKGHRVYVILDNLNSKQYTKPIYVLPEDVEIIQGENYE